MTPLRSAWLLLGLLAACLGPLPVAAEPPPEHPWPFHGFLSGRGRIGIQVQPMTPELREHYGAPADRGVLVVKVDADRPAANAGVRVGDVVLSVAGEPIGSPRELARAVHVAPSGSSLAIELLRGKERLTLKVSPEDAEDPWEELGRQWERGGGELERRLEDLERRLDEMRRRFEQRLRELEQGQQRT